MDKAKVCDGQSKEMKEQMNNEQQVNSDKLQAQQILYSRYLDIYLSCKRMIKPKVQKYHPLVISGCSGVGKGTIITNLIETFPELFQLSVSFTTRKSRPGEIQAKHYFFVSKQQFQQEIQKGVFIEHCEVHGNYYGTSEKQVQSIIQKGKICILDIDLQGAGKIYEKHPTWNYIFIKPPSIESLEHRLRHRGTETEESLKKRLTNARHELDKVGEMKYYKQIMNDHMKDCYAEVIHHINFKYHLLIEVEQK